MNKQVFSLSLVLILLLFTLSLSACSTCCPPPEPSTENTAPSVVTEPTTEPTKPPTEPYYMNVWPSYEDVRIYPMENAKYREAVRVLTEALESTKEMVHVINFDVHWFSYDPCSTDHHIRNLLYDAPIEGWEEEQYYQSYLYFAVHYSIDIDNTKNPGDDRDHETGFVQLRWDEDANTWIIDQLAASPTSHGIPYVREILPPEEVEKLYNGEHRILAGYLDALNNRYYIYLVNQENQEIIIHTLDSNP